MLLSCPWPAQASGQQRGVKSPTLVAGHAQQGGSTESILGIMRGAERSSCSGTPTHKLPSDRHMAAPWASGRCNSSSKALLP